MMGLLYLVMGYQVAMNRQFLTPFPTEKPAHLFLFVPALEGTLHCDHYMGFISSLASMQDSIVISSYKDHLPSQQELEHIRQQENLRWLSTTTISHSTGVMPASFLKSSSDFLVCIDPVVRVNHLDGTATSRAMLAAYEERACKRFKARPACERGTTFKLDQMAADLVITTSDGTRTPMLCKTSLKVKDASFASIFDNTLHSFLTGEFQLDTSFRPWVASVIHELATSRSLTDKDF